MMDHTTRPRTPPTEAQLLTPPASGGFEQKLITDEDDLRTFSDVPSGIVTSHEPRTMFIANNISASFSLANSSNSPSNTSSIALLNKHDTFAVFHFLALPLSVRKMIYTLLLVVPGIICVRQNMTRSYNEPGVYIYAEHRDLRSGISYVLTQGTVGGMKSRFFRHPFVNASILRLSKDIHAEAKIVMYGQNFFELRNLNKETSPRANFTIPLFPTGYPRFIHNIALRAQAMYGFAWIIKGGHAEIKNFYRNLETLTLVLELDCTSKGHGKKFARAKREPWVPYVKRIHSLLQVEIFECKRLIKSVPIWVNLRALFTGDSYVEADGDEQEPAKITFNDNLLGSGVNSTEEESKKREVRAAVSEAFELLKKGGRQ